MRHDDDRSLIEATGTAWPALVDLMTATLMVFLLVGFLQTILRVDALELLQAKETQDRFLQTLRQEFAEELSRSSMEVERHLDFIQIVFHDGLLFDSADHRLKPAGQRVLARCARVFTRFGDRGFEQIQVDGHTDDRPLHRARYPTDNWELSTARAIGVVKFLTAAGLPERLFSANGHADQSPVAPNTTEAGREKNRRIELRLHLATGSAGGGRGDG